MLTAHITIHLDRASQLDAAGIAHADTRNSAATLIVSKLRLNILARHLLSLIPSTFQRVVLHLPLIRLLNHLPSLLAPDLQIEWEPIRLDIETVTVIIQWHIDLVAILIDLFADVTSPGYSRDHYVKTTFGNVHSRTDSSVKDSV